ncbi:MAG TPA: PA14 domain-containing protein [bacterium]|nr:PA14 domain-containing protein [bacterium]
MTPPAAPQKAFPAAEHFFKPLFPLVSVLLGLCLVLRGPREAGWGILAVTAVLFLVRPLIGGLAPTARLGTAVLGWVLTALGLSSVHDYADILPSGLLFHLGPALAGTLFFAGFALMTAAFSLPEAKEIPGARGPGEDLKTWQVALGLAASLGAVLFVGLAHLNEPPGFYWDDNGTVIQDIRTVYELHIYGIIMPTSFREPAITYWTALLWYLFPQETGVHMQRIGPVFMDMAVVLMLYLLGKEAAGRRTGLCLAALGAVNKWYLTETVWGSGLILVVLAMGWSFLALLRIFRDPRWTRFVFFAFAVAFGIYSYGAYRPFSFFMVLALAAWIWAKRKDLDLGRAGWVLILAFTFIWGLMFLWKNGFLPGPLKGMLTAPFVLGVLVPGSLGILLVFTAFRSWRSGGRDGVALKFALALGLTALLVYPLVTHPAYTMRVAELNTFHNGANPVHGPGALLDKVGKTIREIFLGDGFWGDSAFDFQSTWIITLGLAFFWARPSWMGALWLVAALVGLAPHILSKDEYNGRALASSPSFLLLGALGLEGLRAWGAQLWDKRNFNRFFALLLACFFAWQCYTSYHSIFGNWYYSRGVEAMVSRQVVLDSPARRVYLSLAPFCSSPSCQGILDEGHPLYVLRDSNPIFLAPDEAPKDLVVIAFRGDQALKARLDREFPRAQWTQVNAQTFHYPGTEAGDAEGGFYRVLITADQLPDRPGKLFYILRKPLGPGFWVRDFYSGNYGMACGSVGWEDGVGRLRAPFPTPEVVHSAAFQGVFRASADGAYRFTVTAHNYVRLFIDGKKVLDLRSDSPLPPTGRGVLELAKGDHPLRYEVYFLGDESIPDITVQGPGSGVRELDDPGP